MTGFDFRHILAAVALVALPAAQAEQPATPALSVEPLSGETHLTNLRQLTFGGQNAEAWEGLTSFDRPVLTLWASNDPGNLGSCETQQQLIDNIPGAAGSTIWFSVGPTTFEGPVNEYDYVLFTNLTGIIATEDHSWTGVKALFD